MKNQSLRLKILLGIFCFTTFGTLKLSANEEKSWLDELYEKGRQVFYQTVKTGIDRHPRKDELSADEIRKIRESETRYQKLYGIMVNIFYLKDEPVYLALLKESSPRSKSRFRRMYLEMVHFSAHCFIRCFFAEDTFSKAFQKIYPIYKNMDNVDLVINFLGYNAITETPPEAVVEKIRSPEFDRQAGLDSARFRTAHHISKGSGVKIAILDSGIDEKHPIFKDTQWGRHFNMVGLFGKPWDPGPPAFDWTGHGTAVSSIAARYAPGAQITMYKYLDHTQFDPTHQLPGQWIMAAAIYKAVHDGNDVISISASGISQEDDYFKEACQYAYENNRVVICGNLYHHVKRYGQNLNYPGQYRTILSVTAVQRHEDGTLGYWDVTAPDAATGVAGPYDIFGAAPTHLKELSDTYIPSISAAIPTVASLVAMVISVYPRLGTEEPGEYADTIMKLVKENANPEVVGFAGFSPHCGYGLIDAEKTVKAAQACLTRRLSGGEAGDETGVRSSSRPDQTLDSSSSKKMTEGADIFNQGRDVFYQALRFDLEMNPKRYHLIARDIDRILKAEKELPFLYENLMNITYPQVAPGFRRLLAAGDPQAKTIFSEKYFDLCKKTAAYFVHSLFCKARCWKQRLELPGNRGKTPLELVLASFAYGGNNQSEGRPYPERAAPSGQGPDTREFYNQWGLDAARFPSAHKITRGSGVNIAIISSGIDREHGIFKEARINHDFNFSLPGRTGAPWSGEKVPLTDTAGRGTAMASIIRVFAPRAEMRIYKVSYGDEKNPVYPFWAAMQVAQAIYKAVDDGAGVVVTDAGFDRDFECLRKACQAAYEQNVILVTPNPMVEAQADNNGPQFPSHYNSTTAVAGIMADSSNRPVDWPGSLPGPTTAIAAPATVFAAAPQGSGKKDGWITDNDAAAAVAASLVALICSKVKKTRDHLPGQYVQIIYEILCTGADAKILGHRNFTVQSGYGLINAEVSVGTGLNAYQEKMKKIARDEKKRMELRIREVRKLS